MAIALDTSAVGNSINGGNGDSYSFAPAGGADFLTVGISIVNLTAVNNDVISAITWDGVAMTAARNSMVDLGGVWLRCALFYLPAPATGSKTFSLSLGGNVDALRTFISSWSGVKQTSPVDDSDSQFITSTQNRLTLTTTDAGNLILDVGNSSANAMSLGAGQNSLMDLDTSTQRGSYKIVGAAGNYNMDFNMTSDDSFKVAASFLAATVVTPTRTNNRKTLLGVGV